MTPPHAKLATRDHRRMRWLLVALVPAACAACHNGPGRRSERASVADDAAASNASSGGTPHVQKAQAKLPKGPPVTGPSWVEHLGEPVKSAPLGRQGGGASPPARAEEEPMPTGANTSVRFSVTGADLYRYGCQSCHGPQGLGAPDAIPSLLSFVEGSSPALLAARMKAQGHPVGEALIRQLASDGEKAMRDRLHHGGQKMPPFDYLRPDEVDALIAYLKSLAHAPANEAKPRQLEEPALRVGELLVKGTCHACHNATGPGNMHLTMMRGVVPSLASFARSYNPDEIVAKVREGNAGGMMMMMHGENKMPTFPYLTAQEIRAARDYLVRVPPSAADHWPPPPPAPSASPPAPSTAALDPTKTSPHPHP